MPLNFFKNVLLFIVLFISITVAQLQEGYVKSVEYSYTDGRLTNVIASIVPHIGADTLIDSVSISCSNDCVRYQYLFHISLPSPYDCLEKIDLSDISASKSMVDKLEYAQKNWNKIKYSSNIISFSRGALSQTHQYTYGQVDEWIQGSATNPTFPLAGDIKYPITSTGGTITIISDDQ